VVASGAEWPAAVLPHPSWRDAHLAMPMLFTMSFSWVASRRTVEPCPPVNWLYDPATSLDRARRYPVDALSPGRPS
jgi:hypothetical protein